MKTKQSLSVLGRRPTVKWIIIIGSLLGVTFASILYLQTSISASVQNIRVLCWVLTFPGNEKHAHVMNTWGKRCDTFLFMSSENDTNPDVVPLPTTVEGYDLLWGKTREAFKYIWNHHRNDADWFLKADDNTYMILENLRLMLHDYDTNDPIWLGLKYKDDSKRALKGYMAGGPGYVLSKEALKRFVEKALPDEQNCRPGNEGQEDAEIARCLENYGVEGIDTRDRLGRYRFLNYSPGTHISMKPGLDQYWSWIYYPQKEGLECCSHRAVSFHYLTTDELHMLEYLIYHLRPFGIPN